MSPDAARPCAAIPPLPGSLASRAAGARARVPLGMRCSAAGSMGPQTSSLSLASRLLRRRPPPQTCWCASIARRRSAARALVGDAGRFRAGAAVAQMTQNVRDLIACKHAGAQCETAPSGHYSRSASRAGRRSSGAHARRGRRERAQAPRAPTCAPMHDLASRGTCRASPVGSVLRPRDRTARHVCVPHEPSVRVARGLLLLSRTRRRSCPTRPRARRV